MSAANLKTDYITVLRHSPVFGSFPLSLMLIGVEDWIEMNISCPCNDRLNKYLIASMFVGPPLFIFVVMFIMLRPFKNKFCQQAEEIEDDQQNCWETLGHCLIPPMMWIIIMFFDGDYLACCLTTWEGKYVFDEELNRMWCRPFELANAGNQSDQQREFQGYITISKTCGYAVLGLFCVLIFFILGLYDCCISGKCSNHSQYFSCLKECACDCLKKNACSGEQQDREQDSVPLQPNNPDPSTSPNTANEDEVNLD